MAEPPPNGWDDEEATTGITAVLPAFEERAGAPPPRRRRATLTIVAGPNVGTVFSIRDEETVLGRGGGAHVQVKHEGVSRTHARVRRDGEAYVVEDLGSTNGTAVNGQRVARAVLGSGDRIAIGRHLELSFAVLDEQAESLTRKLYESSVRDALTGSFNRGHLDERLAAEISYGRRHTSMVSVVMFDVDHFKRVNDTVGHLAGDAVLRAICRAVQQEIRGEDFLARFGGEEFVVVVRGIEHGNVERMAERLRLAVHRLRIPAEATRLQVTISAGLASLGELPHEERTAEALLRLADQRLYRAKAAGRNRVCAG
jgi:two-component system cell cycle response regulator